MVYSPDKLIICIDGKGDLIIVDDNPRDAASANILRTFEKIHDTDIVCVSFSYYMGVIATADCLGSIMFWDYEFCTLLFCINNVTGVEISQMMFLDTYPLLLIKDNKSAFTFVQFDVDSNLSAQLRHIWRVDIDPIAIVDSKKEDGEEDGGSRRIGKYLVLQLSIFHILRHIPSSAVLVRESESFHY